MCIALPEEGKRATWRGSPTSTSRRPAPAPRPGCASTPRTRPPTCPHDDDELAGLIAELVILAHDEPASAEAMELNFLLLEQRRLEAQIAAAGEADDYERRAALSRERAALVERIARTERVGG